MCFRCIIILISFNKGVGNVHEHTDTCTFKDVFKLTREKLHFEVTDSIFFLIFPEKVITKKFIIITKVKVKEGLCRGCLPLTKRRIL